MAQPDYRPYHHGDLRRSLIETAQAMLAEDQGWQFTMRKLARRAGVSHTAPYKHFPDKASLLGELALLGFDQLREVLVTVVAAHPESLRKAFHHAAIAYIQFGTEHPALYRLMFSAEVGHATNERLNEHAMRALRVLQELLLTGQREGIFRHRPIEGQAAACWAQVHGLTLLSIDDLLLPEKVGSEPLNVALTTLLEGIMAS